MLAILAFTVISFYYEYTDPNYEENHLKELEEEEKNRDLKVKSEEANSLKKDLYVIYHKDEDIVDL